MDIKYRSDLYKLLPENPVVAELGCAEGFFSADICRWPAGKLYMVDLWETNYSFQGDVSNRQEWHDANYSAAMDRVKGLPVVVLCGETVKMAKNVPDGELDLLYIDACHSYECVKNDIHAWKSKVKPGGIIAFHDYLATEYGVNQAANEFAKDNGYEINLIPENQTCDAGAWIRI